jgi:hypothetical protein
MRVGAVLLALPLLALGAAPAQSPPQAQGPRLQTEVDTTLVTVGDPITLLVSVEHAPGTRVAWPDSLELGPFEILGARASGPIARDDVSVSSLTLTLAAYELGELEIPSFQVAVVGPQGDSTLLSSDRFGIRVESVGLDEGGDIRGLKGPLGIPLSPVRIALWALALLLAGALALAAYRRRRRKGEQPQGRIPAAPPRPPHEVALEALARLEASPLLERGEVKEYHIRVSDILRTYVEGRFRVPALEMTTRDILSGLETVGVEASVKEGFRSFLDRCDMVKFAKHRPDAGTSREVLALGRRLVEETIPAAGPDLADGSGRRAHQPASVDATATEPGALSAREEPR